MCVCIGGGNSVCACIGDGVCVCVLVVVCAQ